MYQRSFLPPLTPVVKNLLIVNVLVFLAQVTFPNIGGKSLEDIFANHHPQSKLFQSFQFITSTFMHGSPGHLIGNMLGVYFFGTKLEMVWGAKRFLNFYLICGLAGSVLTTGMDWLESYRNIAEFDAVLRSVKLEGFNYLYARHEIMGLYEEIRNLHTAWNSQPENSAFMPQAEAYLQQVRDLYTAGGSLGASGAVYGLLAGAAYLFPNDEVYFNFFIPLKMKWLVLLYGIATISGIYNNMSDGIAHYAHLGGGIAGFCLVYFVYKRNRQNFY